MKSNVGREERKWREDRAYKESTAVKIKTWGDALRNTITKMPSEGIDVVSWFVSIDKLFEQLNVPADLQAILIRPYLSDRAKLLMSKCDPTHSAKYESIKVFFYLKSYICLQQYTWRNLILWLKIRVKHTLSSQPDLCRCLITT